MKKALFAAMMLIVPALGQAKEIWLSSNTAVATTGVQVLCGAGQRGHFHGVCTDFGVASSSMTIHNSSWTLAGTQQHGPISTITTDQCKYYDTVMPKGLSYFKNNTAAVSILYQCF